MAAARAEYFVSLKSQKQLAALFKTGGKIFSHHLMLRYERLRETHPPFCVVFAVSARLGAAHERNRIKRRLREALYTVCKDGTLKRRGFNLAIVPKKETANLPFDVLCRELRHALERLPKQSVAAAARTKTQPGGESPA